MSGSPYADLNKTPAEQPEQDRLAALSRGHRPNAAAMKVEQAGTTPQPEQQQARAVAQPAPQPESKQAAEYLSAGPPLPMKPEQIIGYHKAAGLWTDENVRAYQQDQASMKPAQRDSVNADLKDKAWSHYIAGEVKTMTPEQVANRLDALGRRQEAVVFEDKHDKKMRGGLRTDAEVLRQDKAKEVINSEIAARTRTPEQRQAQYVRTTLAPYMPSPVEIEKQWQAERRRELDGLPKQERQQTATERERTARLEQSQDAQAQSRDLSQGHRRGI
jgi:hypothetical protein